MFISVEKKILSKLLTSHDNYLRAVDLGITDEFFTESETNAFYRMLSWFYNTYKQAPTFDAVCGAAKISQFSEELKASMPAVYTELINMNVPEPLDFLFDYIIKEYKTKKAKEIIRNNISDLSPDRIDTTFDTLITNITKLKKVGIKNSREGDYKDGVDDRIALYNSRKGKKSIGLTYGFNVLDATTGGHQPGEMWVILGQKKAGKSTMLLNMANHVWKSGKNVVYFSAEVSKEVLERRLDAMNFNISNSALKKGTLTTEEEEMYFTKLKEIKASAGVFEIVDRPGMSTDEIAAKIKELKNTMRIDLVVVDYISIIRLPWKEKSGWERVSNIALELRNIAGCEKIAMLTAHQMNDANEIAHAKDVGNHLDLMLSITVRDEEDRKLLPVCTLDAEIILSRDSALEKFELLAEYDKMTIKDVNSINI